MNITPVTSQKHECHCSKGHMEEIKSEKQLQDLST
jgi:hypothetical protein